MTLSSEQFEVIAEIADTRYDAIALYKTNWKGKCIALCLYASGTTSRSWGDALHMMARRYYFMEDGLTVCLPETEATVKQAR
ncbi:hypothetical protein BJY01DRAFT_221293 [Aspergillus pseudoustus]|uniref:Uncharacterized protein n=1 Tax=Aspergillus pseudoustus TaxID=1810923 RepID=A0ABR4JBK4_9EURO